MALTNYLRSAFDALYERTSNETTEQSPYANTRPRDGVYAITSTQSDESHYGAGEFEARRSDTGASTEADASFDCENPETCPTCDPTVAGTV